ncbi:MAG TPA: ribose 5-phosphate isomerase B [Ruminiclostridium sp.]
MKIAIGCDEAGFYLKEIIKEFLKGKKIEVADFGVHDIQPVFYPDIAVEVAQSVAKGHNERGILICGTGIGMAIVANKVPGIRAAVCHDCYSAERARKSNDAQILTMGARIIGEELAKSLIDIWLASEFQGGGSTSKVNKITEYEQKFLHEQD